MYLSYMGLNLNRELMEEGAVTLNRHQTRVPETNSSTDCVDG
jgi:hypothetical protein